MSSRASSHSLNGQHHPNGDTPPIFDEARVTPLILEWQRTGDERFFAQAIEGSLGLICCLIRTTGAYLFDEQNALVNDCIIKLHKALTYYRADRGRAFSFMSKTLQRFLMVRKEQICRYHRKHLIMPEEELPHHLVETPLPNRQLPQLWSLLSKLQTRFQEPMLMEIQRKMVHQILTYRGRRGHSYLPAWIKPLREEYPQLPYEQMGVLYRYVIIQIRTLLYETYAPALLPRPVKSKLTPLWDALGAERFTRLFYIFGDLCPNLNVLRKRLPGLKNFY